MLTLSSCNFLNAATRHGRYHPRKVKEGIGGFKMTPIQFRRSMFWFVVRTTWQIGRFILTPKTGKLIFSKCFPTMGKATISPIPLRTNYVDKALLLARKYNLPSALAAVRVALASVGGIVYTALWGIIIFVLDMGYLYGKVVYEQSIGLLLGLYRTGFEYLTTYVGQLTDQFLMLYSIVFGSIVLYLVYRVLRYVYDVGYNIYAILCLSRKSVDDFTNELELREEQNRTYFADNFNHYLDKLPIAGRVTTETTREGWVLVKPLFDGEGNLINLHTENTNKNNTKKR